MENKIFKVEGMACEHCVRAVTNAVSALSGVESVSVDLGQKTVAVQFDSAKSTVENIVAAIEDQGYDVVG